jgi:hypothetical protein
MEAVLQSLTKFIMNTQQKWQKKRYDERRDAAIKFLGGECVICVTTHQLEIDHVDPTTKSYPFERMYRLCEEKFWDEIKKCQLLCKTHHYEKTMLQNGKSYAEHGSLTMYTHHKCRCDLCKQANREQSRKYRNSVPRKLLEHGTVNMYTYHKCRCELCTKAQRDKAKEYRDKTRQKPFIPKKYK